MTTNAILYGARGGGATTSDLYIIDPRTGGTTSVGASGFALTGLAYDVGGTTMYGATSNNSAAHPKSLVSVNLSTGAGTFIGSFGGGNQMADIACDSTGQLWGYGAGDHKLYSIDKATGAATPFAFSGTVGSAGNGLAIDGNDTLYVFPQGTSGEVYTLDKATGAATVFCFIEDPLFLDYSVAAATISDAGIVYASANNFTSPVNLVEINLGEEITGVIGPTLASPPLDALSWNQPPALVPKFNGPTWVHYYPTTTSPPAGSPVGIALNESNDRVYFWGPYNGSGYDLWWFDGSDWTMESPTHTPPPTGGAWPMCYDPVHDYILTLANRQTAGVWASETWKYDGSDWSQITVATSPLPLYSYEMAFDVSRSKLVLYGGVDSNTNLEKGNTYTWDGTDWTLANVGVRGTTSPSASTSPGLAYDKLRQKVVAYGGFHATGNTNETWTWGGSSWTKLTPAGAPGNLNIGLGWSDNAHAVVQLNNDTRVTAGATQNQNPTWLWDGTDWTNILPTTTRLSPPARSYITGARVTASGLGGSTFVFGGNELSNLGSFIAALNDTWQFFDSPTLTTGAGTNAIGDTATLNGTVLGLDGVTWAFQWGTDKTYGTTTTGGSVAAGTTSVSEDITGLTAGVTYHFRLVGSTSGTPVFHGEDATFLEVVATPLPTVYATFSLH